MTNDNEIYLSNSARELIKICSELEGILKSNGYEKVES